MATGKNIRRRALRWLSVSLVFLFAQFSGASHAAEFGTDFHHHGDVPCAIQFVCETAKGLSAPSGAAVPPLCPTASLDPLPDTATVFPALPRRGHHIRAPPRS
jgi:hypothetical protein